MMIGSLRWNMGIGVIGFVGTFLISAPKNVMKTVLIQSSYSFISLFLLAFVLRWLLGLLIQSSGVSLDPAEKDMDDMLMVKGQTIDLSTPDDSYSKSNSSTGSSKRYLTDKELSPEDQTEFAPLKPPKLTTKQDIRSEELAKALRHLKDES